MSSKLQEKETNSLKHYIQASLIRDMTSTTKYVQGKEIKNVLREKDRNKKGESESIGTSATRSQIMEALTRRRYAKVKGKNIISTQLGKGFYHLLPEEIKKPDLIAEWWVIQEDIKKDNADVKTLMGSMLEAFVPHLKEDYSYLHVPGEVEVDDSRRAVGVCPVCGNKTVENGKGFGHVSYRSSCRLVLWKEDRLSQSIEKEVALPMMEKLSKDKYCSVKLKEGEQEVIKVPQLGARNGRTVYHLVDVLKKDTSAKWFSAEIALHAEQKKTQKNSHNLIERIEILFLMSLYKFYRAEQALLFFAVTSFFPRGRKTFVLFSVYVTVHFIAISIIACVFAGFFAAHSWAVSLLCHF